MKAPGSRTSGFVAEPAKKVPVVYDVDVAVAGAGVAGVFAAIAAARNGAETVLIDRFGTPGGNMGPGMFVGGSFDGGGQLGVVVDGSRIVHPWIFGSFAGIPKEFIERYSALDGGSVPPYSDCQYMRDSTTASYVALQMLEEAGAKLMLSAYTCDPILEGNVIRGVFVENKSGRQAIKARVVIDGTGEADLARRSGAPVIYPDVSYHDLDGHSPTGMGIWSVIGGVNWEKYEAYLEANDPLSFEIKDLGDFCQLKAGQLTRELRGAEGMGGIAGLKVQLVRPHGNVDAGSAEHISRLEAQVRMYLFETAQYIKNNAPGFEHSYLMCVAPFLGARGGPCIEGQYTLTTEDCRNAKQFDDVIYAYGEPRALKHIHEHSGQWKWTDVPYRVMVAREIDGLMAVGRSASSKPDTLLRNRQAVMHMGQAGGTAAALAVKNGVSPKELNVRELQESLLESGFYLGNRARLKGLGLA